LVGKKTNSISIVSKLQPNKSKTSTAPILIH